MSYAYCSICGTSGSNVYQSVEIIQDDLKWYISRRNYHLKLLLQIPDDIIVLICIPVTYATYGTN